MGSGNNYSPYIQLFTVSNTRIPKGYVINEDGDGLADTTNGVSGIAPYDIEIGEPIIVVRDYEFTVGYASANINKNSIVTVDTDGKITPYIGVGDKIGLATQYIAADTYGKIYTFPIFRISSSGGAGSTAFLGLDDTPSSYVGDGGKTLVVNAAEDAVEFVATPSGENNTASNIGTSGVGLFDGKVGIDLQFKNINSVQSSISLTDDVVNNEVDLDVDINSLSLKSDLILADEFIISDTEDTNLLKKTNLFSIQKDNIITVTELDFSGGEYTVPAADMGKFIIVDLAASAGDRTIKIQNASSATKGLSTIIAYCNGSVNLTITTVGGTQLICSLTSQEFKKSLEAITVTDNETEYIIKQDSRINKNSVDVLAWNEGVTEVLTLEDESKHFFSSTKLSGSSITKNEVAGTVDIAQGEWYLRSTDTLDGDLKPAVVSATSGLSIPNNSTRYIIADYNAGTPNHNIASDIDTIPCQSTCVDAVVSRVNSNLDVVELGNYAVDFFGRYARKEAATNWFEYGGGLQLSDEGSRQFKLTAGALYIGIKRFDIPEFDMTGSDTFTYYYRDGSGGWTEQTAQTQINNTQHDDGSGVLRTGTTGKFYTHHIYVRVNSPTELAVIFPQTEYETLSEARANSGIPGVVPSFGNSFSTGRFVGTIITRYNTVPMEARTPFGEVLTCSTPIEHNDLSAIQLANTSVTYGHIDDQAQSIYGLKSFNDGIATKGSATAPLSVLANDVGATSAYLIGRTADDLSNVYFRNNANTSSTGAIEGGDGTLRFYYSDGTLTEGIRLDDNGRVGIGRISTTNALEVEGTIGATNAFNTGSAAPGTSSYGTLIRSSDPFLCSVETTSAVAPYKIAHFYGDQGQMIIRGDGDIENTNGNYGTISDKRLKENITPARRNYLDDLMRLELVNFNFKGKTQKNIGLIAQDVEKIFPSLVKTGSCMEDGIKDKKTIKQSIFIYLLISAVQELNKKIENLEAKK